MANITKPSGLSNIWAAAGTKVDPGLAKVGLGWVVQLPPYEYQNWVDNRQDQAIAHINQHGVAEWDSATEYQGLLSYTQGSNGVIYKALTTNTNKDPVNSLNSTFWSVAFETYGSVQVVSDALQAHLTNYQTLSGIGNLAQARTNLSVYSKVESDARFAGLNGSSAQVFSVALATQPEHAVRLGQVAGLLTQATEGTLGVVRLATTGVTETGTDDLTAITPLKASTVFLKKSGNLSGLGNITTARNNLGLGTAATFADTAFLKGANNLSDIANAAAARANLGLTTTAAQPETYFLRAGQNLLDVANVSTARNNLGLTSTATTTLSSILLKADNLAGLADTAVARTNLGIGTAATFADTAFLKAANNLSELTNKQAARNNLDLGSAATRNVVGIPSDIDFSSLQAENGYTKLPNGLIMQWGAVGLGRGAVNISFPMPFPNNVFTMQGTYRQTTDTDGDSCYAVALSLTTAQIGNIGRANVVQWFAIGN